MTHATTLTAGASNPLVHDLGAISALVEGLEERREFGHSRSEDGVVAPRYPEIGEDVPIYGAIKAQLQAMGYEVQLQRKRWRVWSDSRQLPTFSPDLHEADRSAEEPSAPEQANAGCHPAKATLGAFIQVTPKSRMRPRQLFLRQSGPCSDVKPAHAAVSRSAAPLGNKVARAC